jgi:two-component system KDP operon response regulator KdpE
LNPNPTIEVIDDDRGVQRLLRRILEPAGYQVWQAETGSLGLQWAAGRKPDVIILELGLPDIEGLSVLQALREWSETPVLVLSERNTDADKVAALDGGANDYVTKPFSSAELLARLRVLRRPVFRAFEGPLVTEGNLTVDLARRQLTFRGQPVKFTPTEEALFCLLLRYFGKVVTFSHLLRCVWGSAAAGGIETLRAHVTHLRAKLGAFDAKLQIRTEEGIGYCLEAVSDHARPVVWDWT